MVWKIGLVGCGTIGSELAQRIQTQFWKEARLIGLSDRTRHAAQKLSRQLPRPVPILSPAKMIPRCDLVIEAASPTAVGELLPKVIAHRKAMICMSTGGILGFPKLLAQAVAHRVPVYLPSGALAGIDGIKAASQGKLHSVTLTTRKPPSAFAGAPGVLRRKSRWNHPSKPRLLFKGPAERAVREFPQNINVAATLSLAGIGPARTKVRVIADPSLKENIHEVEATGPFGKLFVRMENRPSSRNPKTSQIAILSAIATLKQVVTSVKVGT